MKPELYNDLHPKTSLKNTGYANPTIAKQTIKLISRRSLKYQFDVINTMYNRAKYHPNQTQAIRDAMEIFSVWLSKYKAKSERQRNKYPWLSIETVQHYKKFLPMYKNISEDVIKFSDMYEKVGGKSHKLSYVLVDANNPAGHDYYSYRMELVKNMMEVKSKLFYHTGKLKGLPTRAHYELILCAYSPWV